MRITLKNAALVMLAMALVYQAKAQDVAQRGLSAQDVLDGRNRPDVHAEAARRGCTIVLRDGATVANTSIYGVRIVTAPGAENVDFMGNEITGAGP